MNDGVNELNIRSYGGKGGKVEHINHKRDKTFPVISR